MKKPKHSFLLRVVSAFVGALCLFISTPAGISKEPPRTDKESATVDTRFSSPFAAIDPHRLDEVRLLLRRGAYEEAQAILKVLHEEAPHDPWVALYQMICQQRTQLEHPFNKLSSEELATLKRSLDKESKSRGRAAAIQKAVDHQIEKEQAAWDRRLEKLHRVSEREARKRDQQAYRDARARAQAEKAQAKAAAAAVPELVKPAEPAPPSVGAAAPSVPLEPTAPSPAVAPEGGEPEAPVAASGGATAVTTEAPAEGVSAIVRTQATGAVELSPVTVPPTHPESAAPQVVSPSLVGQTLPIKGAVQIHALQMSVSPDNRIAIADGDVEVVFENALMTCDHLTLFTDTKDVYAEGNVRIEEGQQVFRAEMAQYNFETKKGRFLQGTISSPPWYEHGRSVEHIAEGVYEVTPGYLTTCELEPPHFKLAGQRATFFADDRFARMSNVALFVEKMPLLYLPFISFEDQQTPFFIIPGKRKPWGGEFVLSGYRYKLPVAGNHKGTLKLDWRRAFLWGVGLDHQFDSSTLGKGLLKLYYNKKPDDRRPISDLPKGADENRYRLLWRHRWVPMPDTTVVTDIQKYSDVDFRRDFLYREEFVNDDIPESFVSVVTNDQNFTFTGLVKKRINRFQTVTEALPQLTVEARQQRISDTQFFSQSSIDFANFHTEQAHSELTTDATRINWVQQLSYALNLFKPILMTPRAGIRQTYYNKDRQGSDREGDRNLFSGQLFGGTDASFKLFRVFPVKTNRLGLDIHMLRHVLTPTVSYNYIHRPTVNPSLLSFPASSDSTSDLAFGLENKLQTRRYGSDNKLHSAELARFLINLPYTFRNSSNKAGGRFGDWKFDLETYPWTRLRLESDWLVPSHFVPGSRGSRIPSFNLDMALVGGQPGARAQDAPHIAAPEPFGDYRAQEVVAPEIRGFKPGRQEEGGLLPHGQWYLGLGHRYSANDKTEDVLQLDWRLTEKWQIGSFHRFTWKEVAGGSKRFNNLREYQYTLRRDLHDWLAQLVYRVDREFGEEIFFTMTLKAYPQLPIEIEDSYHQPKVGSQSGPFSPVRVQ